MKEAAERAFQDAIDSSLGPNWYKEDQFQLIIDALEGVDDAEFSVSLWKSTVEILAYASGESTFQRYVRYAKGALIGHLARVGRRAEALATYRHYLLPSHELQKQRIRAVDVDMTTHVSGGRFGVQEVDEQRAALEMLEWARPRLGIEKVGSPGAVLAVGGRQGFAPLCSRVRRIARD